MSQQSPTRESVATINADGSRNFLHPADVSGRFTLGRRIVAFLFIALFVALPWIPIGGYPAVFLDAAQGRFHLLGFTIASQDFWIVFFMITGLGFSLFFITALLGRVWCGWACPQTLFMEHVFRRIERWLEGDHIAQKRLDSMAWSNPEKMVRRGGKFLVFLGISAVIAHVFLAYFVSLPELYRYMSSSPLEHWNAFLFVGIATGLLFFNFTWFREQLCIIICPYGRFQSALIDDDSLVIGYDEKRGEPRGPARDSANGDCIDCKRCVQVCPTGIDIRQGLQMECIGCANCIDACDAIMTKIGRPRGLIRYDSLNGLEGRVRSILRPRVFLYAALMIAGVSIMTLSLLRIKPVYLNVTRMAASPFTVDEADRTIRNQYNIRLINKTNDSALIDVSIADAPAGLEVIGISGSIRLEPRQEVQIPMVLRFPIAVYPGKFEASLRVVSQDSDLHLTESFEFIGPDPARLKARYAN